MWETTTDARAFMAAAGAFLRSRPVEHTVLLTVGERLERGPADDALLGWWSDGGGEVAGAFMHTPPYGVLLAADAAAAGELGSRLRADGRPVHGVNAEESVAAAFAEGFGARATCVHQRHRLHRLAELVPPDPPPPGAARAGTGEDGPLLEAWVTAFGEEAGDRIPDVAGLVADRLSNGGFMLWEDDGGPVALASSNPAVEGVVRIGPVYTPPEARRRGYGAGVTAAAAAAALDDGAREVLLFTDLANPTSNALYARLGFVALEDRVLLDVAM